MQNVFDILNERGFVKQTSNEQEIREALGSGRVTFYIGFDPTADSLHVGHFVQLMAMAHLQRAGHRPIALLGGGTTMIGDPSGKSDMRTMMTKETIAHNAECFKKQMGKFIEFDGENAIMVNNADWLLNINYVDFLREVGVHFSVNRMLTADCYKQRLERGLTFMEFNYMLMQAYDFLVLNEKYGATMQMGGDDQWSNILAGADLIRRKFQRPAHAMTFALLTTSEGVKMGKTVKGALWLDENKTTPYEFYQYWRNIADADVYKCLSLLTFLPMDEVRRLSALKDSEINEAKKVLAYEVTKQVHGEEKAEVAKSATEALFSGAVTADADIPTVAISKEEFASDRRVAAVLALSGLAKSKGDGRRLIEGGGIYADDEKVEDPNAELTEAQLAAGVLLKKGKKSYKKVILD